MLATAESMARDNPFLEFRLDYLKQPLAALPKVHRFLETHQYVTAIGTCRRADNGGKVQRIACFSIRSADQGARRRLSTRRSGTAECAEIETRNDRAPTQPRRTHPLVP